MTTNKQILYMTLIEMDDRLARFKKLQKQRKKSQNENRRDLYKEYKRNRLDPEAAANNQKRLDDRTSKVQIESLKNNKGHPVSKSIKKKDLWNYSVEDNERWNNKQLKNQFDNDIMDNNKEDDFDTLAKNTYLKQIALINDKRLKNDPAVTTVSPQQSKQNDQAYNYDHQPDRKDINLLVENLKTSEQRKQNRIAKTKLKNGTSSSKAAYINVKNKEFNEKLSRQYDKYTKDLRENLEKDPF